MLRYTVVLAAALGVGVGLRPAVASGDDPAKLPVVHVDGEALTFVEELPTRKDFIIRVALDGPYPSVTLTWWVGDEGKPCGTPAAEVLSASGVAVPVGSGDTKGDATAPTGAARTHYADVRVGALDYNQPYCFRLEREGALPARLIDALNRGLEAGVEALLTGKGKKEANTKAQAACERAVDTIEVRSVVPGGSATRSRKIELCALTVEELATIGIGSSQAVAHMQDAERNVAIRRAKVKAFLKSAAESFSGVRSAYQKAEEALRATGLGDGSTDAGVREDIKTVDLAGLVTLRRETQSVADLNAAVARALCSKSKKDKVTNETCLQMETFGVHVERLDVAVGKIQDAVRDYRREKAAVDGALAAIRGRLRVAYAAATAAPTSTQTPTFSQRSGFYVTADVGAMVPLFVDGGGRTKDATIAAVFAIHFYFARVDKDQPLKGFEFLRRFSLGAGLTLHPVVDKSKSVEGVIGEAAPFIGLGFRATDYLRLGAGAFFYYQKDKNPTLAERHFQAGPYFSLSIDIDIAGTIYGWFSKAKGN